MAEGFKAKSRVFFVENKKVFAHQNVRDVKRKNYGQRRYSQR